MKKQFSFVMAILLACTVYAQDPVDAAITPAHPTRTGQVAFNGVEYPCSVTDYDAATDVVQDAIKSYMQSLGYKPDSRKGFMVYRNVRLTNVNNGQPVDLLILVETKSRQEKDKSTVYSITSEPGKIPDKKVDKGSINPAAVAMVTGAGTLLAELNEHVVAKEFNRLLSVQQDVVAKTERKLKDLQNDYASMKKKMDQLQKDMTQNQKDQEATSKMIEEEKKKLAEMEVKKPGTGN
ncbi:hypothetical protein [Phnomibacter ginsenosidimutans]|uniref:Uncharacterized protein n=1 Tax=Phnomibacter ginsenosidimutans TaxID=2676868 RepID=A0A6I6G9L8_9BACT|nr:hypothetical protein [Phnomibacter ginsenosidimutans]QGW26730.1 hypothetical protein GLV81_00165 [Phnomibacter ginsenosidimutans]